MKTGIINPYEINTTRIQEIPEVKTIKISREAFYKMNLYSSIVSEISGDHKECLGTLLNYKNRDDNAVRDIHLWAGQKVTASSGWRGEYLDDIKEADKRGMNVIGFWHSHGYNGVFHSSNDNSVLKETYPEIKNKIIVGEKVKDLECITDGETVRIFEEGKNKELRIKGKIEGIKCVEWDKEYFVLNSIVVNKNSYSGGFSNPKLNHDYDAEVWVGYNKEVKREYKTFKHVLLEIIEENNNIRLDEEELVKEVGEKVKLENFHFNGIKDPYLKDLPNYQKVLDKYKQIKDAKTREKHVEQTVKTEERPEKKSELTDIIQNQANELIDQETEHNQELRRTKTYMERLEGFYDVLNSRNDSSDKILAELCRAYSGKQDWLWAKRFETGNEILKILKKKYLTPEQKNMLGCIKSIVGSSKYLKRNHPLMFKDIQRRLSYENSSLYCNLSYWKDRLFYKLSNEKRSNTLEKVVRKANENYQGKFKNVFKKVAKYAGIAALATALAFFPAKYAAKRFFQPNERTAVVYTVKEGDNLWNMTQDYLKKNGVKPDNKTIYKTVDKVAEDNGKGKQAEYKIGSKEEKNPHYIKPGQKISFSKKILEYVKKGGKK